MEQPIINKLDLSHLKGTDFSIQDQIVQQGIKLKEQVLTEVVKKVLGKDTFTDDEVKEFSFIHNTHMPGREFIGYKGHIIGELVWNYGTDVTTYAAKVTLTFIPSP